MSEFVTRLSWLAAGIIFTAAVWWLTERWLDRHIGPKVGESKFL